MRWRFAVCLAVAWPCALISAQVWPSISPIPREERFVVSNELAATLQLQASQLPAGEQPAFTLTLRNVGRRTLRLPPQVSTNLDVRLRVFDSSGEELHSAIACSDQRIVLLSSVRTFVSLAPREARVFPLESPCGGLPELRAGDYQWEATYSNYPDYALAYDVYERGATDTWAGRVTTPRVAFRASPLDAATERSLIALVDSGGPDDAIRRLGLGGTASATPALIRRFERDPQSGLAVASALAHIEDPGAAEQLGDAIERLSFQQRWLFVPLMRSQSLGSLLTLARRAPGCGALPLALAMGDGLQAALGLLDDRCPDLRARLRGASEPPVPPVSTPEAQRLAERAQRAAALLRLLDASPDVPPSRVEEEWFPEEIRPDPADVPEYVRDLVAGIGDDEREVKGVARFGTVDDFVRLKDAFATREESRGLLSSALIGMTFISDRDTYPSRQPAYWDAWWKQHAGKTRVEWAREALERDMLRTELVAHDEAPARAADYLLAVQGLSPGLVRELAQHRSWLVRLALADAVSRADEQSGGRLFIRELSNLYVEACSAANERLELLVRRRYHFDCSDPEQRRQAITRWTETVNRLEPGFLRLKEE